MKLFIGHMVSQLCKIVVSDELQKVGIKNAAVELGVVETKSDITEHQRKQLKTNLLRYGLELLDDKTNILIERIKNVVIDMIHHADDLPTINYSHYISKQMGLSYTYLANIFSMVKGVTIRQYIINNKIERVKELLLEDEMNLTEISYKLNYSSVAHLSNQFKKVEGVSPSIYKGMKDHKRVALDCI